MKVSQRAGRCRRKAAGKTVGYLVAFDDRFDNTAKGKSKKRISIYLAGLNAARFNGVYLGGNGQARPCYHLPRFECDLVVSGYSVKYRAAIIRRWHELESPTDGPAREYAEKARQHILWSRERVMLSTHAPQVRTSQPIKRHADHV